MESEIINRKLRKLGRKELEQKLLELQRTGVAKEVRIRYHSGKDIESWSEVNITTSPENRDLILSTLKNWGI